MKKYEPETAEPESLDQLRGDCARMDSRWSTDHPAPAVRSSDPARPAAPQGVHVPSRSAHLLDGMSDYGD